MSAPATTAHRKMSLTTVISSFLVLLTVIWATWSFFLIQGGAVRTEIPHERFDDIQPWPYNINWTGGRSSWFENLNYTNLPLNVSPPSDILQQLENVVFLAAPTDPPQLWRSTAYDHYDGSSWSKTLGSPIPATTEVISRSQALAQGNPIYNIYLNLTAGPNVGSVELPTLFPTIQVIAGSFETGSMVSGTFQPDSPSRLLDMELETDSYGTLLLNPLLEGPTGTSVLLTYEVTYRNQNLANVANNAREGVYAPAGIATTYSTLAGVTLTQRVLDEIAPFEIPGLSAFDAAMAVSVSFRSKYNLMIGPTEYMERPAPGQEVTDWFIQRGGGLPMDFATAYCVFMRHLDIPARIVIGYAVGDPTGSYRTIRVRHMMFWAEVFVPMYGSPTGGEWIQMVPIPLPSDMGGGETPENTGQGSVQLFVGPSQWAMIGDNFNLSALLLFQGVPVSTPEVIYFRDETDGLSMGTAAIQMGTFLPLANITYAFPVGSTLGFHTISATWYASNFSVTNYTIVSAVGNPNPMTSLHPIAAPDFLPSEVVDLDIKLGLDNYTAHWTDIVNAHGVMTVSGAPVNGTLLRNNQMQIMWDEGWIGNATINGLGYYELNITVNPNDLVRMKAGPHKLWAQYAGEWDGPFPVLLPARSADNSTVTVWGIVGFSLTVWPQNAYRGSVLVYDGRARLLNGTVLVGRTIGVFLNGTQVNTAITNSTGGFRSTYSVPTDYPFGVAYARVNWTSTMNLVSGNWSNPLTINILPGGTLLIINSTPRAPQVVHIYQSILIYGYLVHATNGSGIVGQTIRVWWQQGASAVQIGSNVTGPGGYYQFRYTVPTGYEGSVTYWTQFNSSGPPLVSSRSVNMTIRVQKWAVQVSIRVDRNPVHLLETVTVTGNVSLPEIPAYLGNARVTIWWSNSTRLYNLTVVLTSPATFLYTYSIPVSLNHNLETVMLWSQFVSPDPSIASNESIHLSLQIVNYDTTLTVFSDRTSYHLNETVHIWGRLRFENGSPWSGRTVSIYWINGSVRTFFSTTNSTGWYSFYYNCSVPKDANGTVGVQVSFTSPTRLFDNATALLSPSLTLRQYQVIVYAGPIAAQYHLDDIIVFSGNLTFQENGAPLVGASVTIYYKNGTNTYLFPKITDNSGGFTFRYNCSVRDALGGIYIWARYTSSNPLWTSGLSANRTATLILYQFQLTANPNTTTYHLNETILITGRLTYINNGTPLAGQSISIHWNWNNGTIRLFGPYQTNLTGYFRFYYNCSVPKDRAANVTIWAEFTNSVKLWNNASSPTTVIQLVLYQLVFSVDAPSSVTLDRVFLIQGNVTYAGGTPVVAGAVVSTYLRVGANWVLMNTSVTNSRGEFRYFHRFSVPPDVPRVYIFKCNCTRISLLTSSATIQIQVNAQVIRVNVVANGSALTSYLGQTFTVYGTLTFENGTGMVGYSVTLDWDNGFLNMTTYSGPGGAFSVNLFIPWTQRVGRIDYFVAFNAPTAAFEPASSNVLQVDIYDLVQLHLDPQTVFVVVIGQSFTVSGYVSDGGGRISGAGVNIIVDSTAWGTESTRSDGTFSFSEVVPSGWSLGSHTVTLSTVNPFYEIQGTPDYWTIEVHMGSNITMAFIAPRDIMPGETLNFTLRLQDSTGASLTGSVSLYLNDTMIGTRMVSGSITTSLTVSVDWSSGSGLFRLSGRYSGAGFVEGCVGETTNTIHVFTSNVQFNHETPSRIDPGSTLTIICLLTDDSTGHIPIVGRTVMVHLNSTSNYALRTTGPDGRITCAVLQQAPRGFYDYYVTLVSSVVSVDSDTYTVEIQPMSGLPLNALLLLFWTAAIVIEVIVAYIVIRRHRPGSLTKTRWSRHRLHIRLPRIRLYKVVTNAGTD